MEIPLKSVQPLLISAETNRFFYEKLLPYILSNAIRQKLFYLFVWYIKSRLLVQSVFPEYQFYHGPTGIGPPETETPSNDMQSIYTVNRNIVINTRL